MNDRYERLRKLQQEQVEATARKEKLTNAGMEFVTVLMGNVLNKYGKVFEQVLDDQIVSVQNEETWKERQRKQLDLLQKVKGYVSAFKSAG